jgi:hypothetical protein
VHLCLRLQGPELGAEFLHLHLLVLDVPLHALCVCVCMCVCVCVCVCVCASRSMLYGTHTGVEETKYTKHNTV